MTYNKETAERLVAEALEDDGRMTQGPWEAQAFSRWGEGIDAVGGRWRIFLRGHVNPQTNSRDCDWRRADAHGIARTRNNLRAMAEQLRAASALIEQLRAAYNAQLPRHEWVTELYRLQDEDGKLRQQLAAACEERDAAVAEVERMRPVYDASMDWHRAFCRSMAAYGCDSTAVAAKMGLIDALSKHGDKP